MATISQLNVGGTSYDLIAKNIVVSATSASTDNEVLSASYLYNLLNI